MAADPITKNTVSDLLNYDVSDEDDPFKDIDETLRVRDDKSTLSPRAAKRKAEDDKENDILGLDEEVKITKKRKPIAKLDETRLLSQAGIPKLRTLARSGQVAKKLHLRGKGHEFSDAAKLLNYYQLWLDNLYPRAKFADGLQLVEKAGHSKRMQTMRKEWIDEGKPGYARDKPTTAGDTLQIVEGQESATATSTDTRQREDNGEAAARPVANQSVFGNGTESEALFFPDNNTKLSGSDDDAAPEDDELDALLAEQRSSRISLHEPAEPESEGEDDLDALLAEQESRPHQLNTATNENSSLNEEDDLDALLAERDASSRDTGGAKVQEEPVEDGDDLNALLAERESREVDGADAGAQSSPFPIIDEEEEDSGPVT